MRVVVVTGLLAACGRIGFDPLTGDGDGGAGDPDALALDAPWVHAKSRMVDARCATDVYSAESIVVDDTGDLFVGGCVSGAGSFGDYPYSTTAQETGYVAAFDRNLVPDRTRVFTSTAGTSGVFEVGFAQGSIYASGIFDTAIDIGDGALSTLGADDVFAARYAPATLAHQWSGTYGSTGDDDTGYGLATFADGSAVIGASCDQSFAFGGAPLAGAEHDPCIGIVRDDTPIGSYRWVSAGTGGAYTLAVLPGGDMAVGGYYMGAPPFPGLDTGSVAEGFVARVAQNGAVRWAAGIVGAGDEATVDVETTGEAGTSGEVYAMGNVNSAVTIAGRSMPFAGVYDGWIARFDDTGTLVWATMIGGAGDDEIRNAAIIGDTLLVAGNFSGMVQFGNSDLVSSGNTDIFVAALSRSDGSVRWAKRFGGAGQDRVRSTILGSDRLYMTGIATPPVDFGGGSLTGTQTSVFLLALAPP